MFNKVIGLYKRSFSEFLLYFFIFVFAARSANFLENRVFIVFVLFYSFVLFLLKKKKFDGPIIFLLLFWTAINALVLIQFDSIVQARFITFLSVTSRYLFPYFVLKTYEKSFFKTVEQIIFLLSLVSLPIFALQLIMPSVFYAAAPMLNMFAVEQQQLSGGWYLFFYMFNGWSPERNSGFMWEPGAFAFMIILGMIIRLSKNDFTLDKHIYFYLIAVISTFSTMGYVVVLLIAVSWLVNKKKINYYLLIIPAFLLVTYYLVLTQDFMLPKIEQYYDNIDTMRRSGDKSGNILRLNRFGILAFAFNESLNWPWGYGIFDATPAFLLYGENIVGPNTYAQILLRWGWIGIGIFLLSVYKLTNRLFPTKGTLVKVLLFMAICASVFSYNLLHNSVLLAMLYFPFVCKESLLTSSYKQTRNR